MKRLKQILIGLICIAFLLPIIERNNVYAYEPEKIADFSINGRVSYYDPANGTKAYVTPDLIDFTKYLLFTVTFGGYCEPNFRGANAYRIDIEDYDTGIVYSSIATDSLPTRSYERVSVNFSIPKGVKKGKIIVNYDWGNMYTNSSSEYGSCWSYGDISAILNPVPSFESSSGNLHTINEAAAVLKK